MNEKVTPYGKVIVVMDGQAGSCGKGKLIGHLVNKIGVSVAVNNFMSNAGHTFEANDGRRIMTQHLPSSIVNPTTMLCIGPGAAITPSILFYEIEKYADLICDRKIYIHPRAMVILPKHADKEKELVRSGSTFKGCGIAQADKIMRVPGTMLFGEYYNKMKEMAHCEYDDKADFLLNAIEVTETSTIINDAINMGMTVIIEGSQGFDLDINYGLPYPNTTSRQCNAGQLVADCGISPRMVSDIFMLIRPYPIRISNQTNIGLEISSGNYDGAEEISWDIVRDRCSAPKDIEFGEITTVTKKPRRVFEMNWDRLKFACTVNRPTGIFINFAQYLDWGINGMTQDEFDSLSIDEFCDRFPNLDEFISKVEKETGCPVIGIGTGAKDREIALWRL